MAPTHRLAFDLGASSCRAIVGTWDGGRMHLEEVHRFETPIIERDGSLRWDLSVIEHGLRDGLASALQRFFPLRSLSVDSWAVDYVRVGPDGSALDNPFCYRDRRTEGLMDEVLRVVPAAEIFGSTGIQFLPFNTLYQAVADVRTGLPPARIHLLMADWFNHRFGGAAVIERSMASSTQMMDARTGQWAPFVDRLGLDRTAWPRIVPSGTVTGYTEGGIPVVASCSHDTAAAVAAAPATPGDDWAYVSCGTWSLLGCEMQTPVLTEEARLAGFTNEAGLDGTIRFLSNLTGLWTLQECMREWAEQGTGLTWDALEAAAHVAGPSPGTIDLENPRFTPRGGMEARLRAAILERGLPDPPSPGHLARLILESIAASYARGLRALEGITGRPVRVLHLSGGGSRNALLCRLSATACGIPVIAGPEEATALGNLLIQARTTGDLPAGLSVREASARSCVTARFDPD